MSIKAKLSLLISLIVTGILSLNITIYYISSKSELRSNAEKQMVTIAKQIGSTLESTEKSKRYLEDTIGEKLRIAALSAKQSLPPRIADITNEQLADLSRTIGVDHITLWQRTSDDIVVKRSSDPTQLKLSAKTWDYWYTAFNQLFDLKPVTVPQGQKLDHYWAGPVQYSSGDANRIDKWGYYYDGTTDYMINPYVDAKVFLQFTERNGTDSLIEKLLADNPDILGIVGFDPAFFGKPPILKMKNGVEVQNLDVRDVVFGEYSYKDTPVDVDGVSRAAASGSVVSSQSGAEGKTLLKSFIPLGSNTPCVVGVTFDEGAIERVVNRQLLLQSIISLSLILASWVASYLISGLLIRPLRLILRNVNDISEGRFGSPIEIRSRDELSLLASRVNVMADNLQAYMGQLQATAEELRGTKEYLESFVNNTSDAIHVTDLEGKIIQVNRAYEKMFGWTTEEALNGTPPHIPDKYIQETRDIRARVLLGESVADYETVRLRKDGGLIDISITVSGIRDERGNIVAIAIISRNITARKQAEEVIRRSEKLSVVGQLAAGVAHEIRNPLTTLRGFVQLQKQHGRVTDEHLEVMLSELDRINLIVSEFLVLAKPQAVQFEYADLRSLLQNITLLLDSQANLSNVQFAARFPAKVPQILCEANQLKQVFINVLKNAIEAMPDGGTITIDLEQLKTERQLRIRIQDQGCGIPEDQLARLGEPFFTSKPAGNGLGLMVTQRILANHKGSMNITSEIGKGTCVDIRLPVA